MPKSMIVNCVKVKNWIDSKNTQTNTRLRLNLTHIGEKSNLTHIGSSVGRASVEKIFQFKSKCQQLVEWKQKFSHHKILIFLKHPFIFHHQTENFFCVHYCILTHWEKPPDYVILKPFWVRLVFVNLAVSFDSTSARMWLLFTSDIRDKNVKF